MRVALYARVSTKQHGQDVETQLVELRRWAKQKKYTVAGEYADRGVSGAKDRRPELDRCMADAKRKKFDAVAVWRFDRFARSVKHLLSALDDFRSWGIDFVSLSENVDTSTPMGKLVFVIMAALAEFMRSVIRENVQSGVDRARREGKHLGRPRKHVDEKEICRQVKAQQAIKGIARQWNLARSTVRAIVKRNQKVAVSAARGRRGLKHRRGAEKKKGKL